MGGLAWNGRVVLTGLGNSQLAYSARENPSGFLMPATPWSVIVGRSLQAWGCTGGRLERKVGVEGGVDRFVCFLDLSRCVVNHLETAERDFAGWLGGRVDPVPVVPVEGGQTKRGRTAERHAYRQSLPGGVTNSRIGIEVALPSAEGSTKIVPIARQSLFLRSCMTVSFVLEAGRVPV